jgi:hypothetical protein
MLEFTQVLHCLPESIFHLSMLEFTQVLRCFPQSIFHYHCWNSPKFCVVFLNQYFTIIARINSSFCFVLFSIPESIPTWVHRSNETWPMRHFISWWAQAYIHSAKQTPTYVIKSSENTKIIHSCIRQSLEKSMDRFLTAWMDVTITNAAWQPLCLCRSKSGIHSVGWLNA